MPIAALLALGFGLIGQAPAEAAAPIALAPATLQGAGMFDMPSRFTGRTHRVYLAVPDGPAPKAGWPVVFVLDGDGSFATALTQMPSADERGRRRAILVGIGYGKARKEVGRLRVKDLTPSQPDALSRLIGQSKPDDHDFGGADDFHRFITDELTPRLAAAYPIDRSDEALIGYSLGGLFALHTLFTHPTEFRTVVAGSPSIWWNHREVLKDEPAFEAAVTAGKAKPRILITSGGLEETPLGVGAPDTPEMRKLVTNVGMISAAKSVADRLAALHGAPGYQVRYVLFDGEGHNEGEAAAMSRAINFAVADRP